MVKTRLVQVVDVEFCERIGQNISVLEKVSMLSFVFKSSWRSFHRRIHSHLEELLTDYSLVLIDTQHLRDMTDCHICHYGVQEYDTLLLTLIYLNFFVLILVF